MPSITVENYIKQLYHEQQKQPDELVSMGRLAEAMNVVPGTATTMIKALADSNLVSYEPRMGVKLTASGEKLALHVLRRHRLVELFLVKIVGLDWSEVHNEAEELEHVISEKVLNRIDALLGHPRTDPHGDPIPPAKGRMVERPQMSLASCELNATMEITRILDQDPRFLQFVERNGLVPGTAIVVEKRDAFADAVLVRGNGNEQQTTLGTAAAGKILVAAARRRNA